MDRLSLDWLEPWRPVGDEASARALETELEREVPIGHVLHAQRVRALGRREDCDDVLFALVDAQRVAVVHLTWSRETDPKWPRTAVYESLESFSSERMALDHSEFCDDAC